MCWEVMAPEETPWCNGKAGAECDNGLKRRIAHTSLRLSVTRGANTVQFLRIRLNVTH